MIATIINVITSPKDGFDYILKSLNWRHAFIPILILSLLNIFSGLIMEEEVKSMNFERANELIQELNQFNKQEINEEIKQTNQKFMKLTEKNQYLKKVQQIHREKNGSINKIIYFLQNLDYLGIDNTEDYSWTLIPEPVLNV